MGLDELKEYYRSLKPDELKEDLAIDLAFMKLLGKLDPKYVIKLNIAQENKILSKEEINEYKLKGFEALSENWKY